MYYHCRELKYVTYGKVFPPPLPKVDADFDVAYQWLGKYCGFYPQIWLSRSQSWITGIRSPRNIPNKILFGFEPVQGFPVSFQHWDYLLGFLLSGKNDPEIVADLDAIVRESEAEKEELGEVLTAWKNSSGWEDYLQRYVFVECDQVVVPSLNLKSAKQITCRNEFQKKKLRRMGFIKDRISIRKMRTF